MKSYYKIPNFFENVPGSQKLIVCDLTESIRNFIHLIIFTNYDEFRYDRLFGCGIWEKEFEILPHESKWQVQIKNNITEAIQTYETRLQNVKIELLTRKTSAIRKKIIINITGIVKETAEPYEQTEIIYLCPKSIE